MASTDREVLLALCHSIGGADWLPHNWSADTDLTKWRYVWTNSDGRVQKFQLFGFSRQGRPLSTENCCSSDLCGDLLQLPHERAGRTQ